ncbi:MAG: hypothetical protein KA152_12410 [Verrucomicrobiales bacterium]|nr:hypothetical protein [Verrucomicrobiales bacterium]
MADSIRILTVSRISLRGIRRRRLIGMSMLCLIGGFGMAGGVRAQTPQAAAYPVDQAAAAGMTTGLPNGVTSQRAEMMQVRTSAQGAQGEAAAALMARSADQSMEERNRELALQAAREKKSIKQSMTDRLKYDRAETAVNKVSANDMSTWKTQGGGVRVERNVPDAFMSALIAEEEQTAKRTGASSERKGFGLFRKDRQASSSDSGGGFLSGIHPPRLPFMGGRGGDSAEVAPSPPPSDNSEPTFVQTGAPAPGGAPASSSTPAPANGGSKPAVVPAISGAALVEGRSTGSQAVVVGDRPPSSPPVVSSADRMPDPDKKKPGLFSKFQSNNEESEVPVSSSGGGGFFGFGKKKAASTVGTIDAGLFPEGSVSQAPEAGRPIESYTKVETGPSESFASASPGAAPAVASSSSSGSVLLPGQTVEKSRGFTLPKPSLSIPSIKKSERSDSVDNPQLTTVNSGGSSYYVVANTAQFMVYGASQLQSEVRALPAGTLVLMTKPGEQWASVRLANGTEGILQNKNLRPAAAGEASVEFAAPAPATASTR